MTQTITVGCFKKPEPGNVLKTSTVLYVQELINDIPSRSAYITDGQIVLLLQLNKTEKYILLNNNKKYLYTHRLSNKRGGFYLPFTIVC